jgi:hypothetical protein
LVAIAGVEFHVDLTVNSCFALDVEILARLIQDIVTTLSINAVKLPIAV